MSDRESTPRRDILGIRKTMLASSVVAALGAMTPEYGPPPRRNFTLKPVDPDKKAKRTAQAKARAVTRKNRR